MNQDHGQTKTDIRLIGPEDNAIVADIIRSVMTEFQAVGWGFSINDSEVEDMYSAYTREGSAFYVALLDGDILGCGGFGPLKGADKDTCELRKMYFKPELRGLGIGQQLLLLCLKEARNAGYNRCYLETMDDMEQARLLYGKHGFKYLDRPMGNTGHNSCQTWMLRNL